jgi:hypothetical protein
VRAWRPRLLPPIKTRVPLRRPGWICLSCGPLLQTACELVSLAYQHYQRFGRGAPTVS